MSSQSRILVTGASGFVGSQIVEHLLNAGYAVRGTSRSNKAEQLLKNCPHPNFEVVIVDDLIAGDFFAVLQDINAVIHVASPTIGKVDPVEVAIGGTMNIIRQAYDAKVFKVTVLSSFSTLFNSLKELDNGSLVLTDKDWKKGTKEDVKPDTPAIDAYTASKALAERAAWDFAESHPELDLITILPPFIFGPLPRALVVSDPTSLSTDGYLYQLLAQPVATYPAVSARHAVDIRDVATAAVLSLSATKKHPGEQRRIILHDGSFNFTWTEVVRHLAHARPELKSRLVDGGEPAAGRETAKPVATLDTSKAREVLGLSTFIDWKQSVTDAVDSILQRESAGEL